MMMPAPAAAAGPIAKTTLEAEVRKLAIFGGLFLSSALLHAVEISITTLYPWKVKEFAEAEGPDSCFAMLDKDVTRVLTTVLVATTLCNIASTAIFADLVARHATGPRSVAAATGALTALTLFFGELLPKTIGVSNAERTARLLGPPVGLMARLVGPLATGFAALSKWVIKTCGLGGDDLSSAVSEEEVRMVVGGASASGGLEAGRGAMIGGVLDLQQRRVAVDALASTASARDLLRLVNATGHSRVPVYDDEIDNVVGVVNAKQLFAFLERRPRKDVGETLDGASLGRFCEPTYFVPETMVAWKVLEEMRRRRTHMAIVVDEHGGTAGIVTLEDILETVVGEIYDEDDEPELELGDDVVRNADGSWALRGSANLEDTAAVLGFADVVDDVPDVSTVAGFVCFHAGEIPAVGDHVVVYDFDFEIVDADERLVKSLRAVALDADGVIDRRALPDLCEHDDGAAAGAAVAEGAPVNSAP